MRYFSFYDCGSYDGEDERRIMVSFFSVKDGEYHPGQSEIVRSSDFSAYRKVIEGNGWTHANWDWSKRAICATR